MKSPKKDNTDMSLLFFYGKTSVIGWEIITLLENENSNDANLFLTLKTF